MTDLMYMFFNFVLTVGRQFLIETKTNNETEGGESYSTDPGFEIEGRDYNNHINYCKAFPWLSFCLDTIRKLGLFTKSRTTASTSSRFWIRTTTSTATRNWIRTTTSTRNWIRTTTSTRIWIRTTTSRTTSIPRDRDTGSEGCSCGRPWRPDEISGGKEAKPHNFPWIVRLFDGCPSKQDDYTEVFYCKCRD